MRADSLRSVLSNPGIPSLAKQDSGEFRILCATRYGEGDEERSGSLRAGLLGDRFEGVLGPSPVPHGDLLSQAEYLLRVFDPP